MMNVRYHPKRTLIESTKDSDQFPMSIATKIGDLFSVPLDTELFGVGVVAGKWKKELFLVLFSETFDNAVAISETNLGDLTPFLASSSLDAKIWHGHWPIIRRNVDVSSIAQPAYKIEEPSGTIAESFDRKHRTLVNSSTAQQLNYRKGVAPVRLENALKAYHGLGQWDSIYDELKYENVERSSKLLVNTTK